MSYLAGLPVQHLAPFACMTLLALALQGTPAPESVAQERPADGSAAAQGKAGDLERAFAAQRIHLDLERGLCAIPATILVREDLLEYLLVNPRGAAHESTFVTDILPSQLNIALLALGVAPGKNATWVQRNPPPDDEARARGESAYEVKAPEGDGFYLYAAWKSGQETYLYRVEDLLLDRATGQTMRRHKWVYLGSRLVRPRGDDAREVFAADLEGNLINIALFEQGNTLVTAALPECLEQTIWMTNFWLVPPRDAQVELIFSRHRLSTVPEFLDPLLPVVEAPERPQRQR